jgi:hypothetical protein
MIFDRTKSRKRRGRGSAIAEFGPAMYILIMVFFFPFLDLIGMACEYGDCLYLNSLLLRQAALENVLVMDNTAVPPALTTDLSCSTNPSGSLNTIIQAWMNGGLGKFASSGTMPTQSISVDLTEGTRRCKYVHLTLNVECKPFVTVPFFLRVEGLNAPITFVFYGRAVIENIPS